MIPISPVRYTPTLGRQLMNWSKGFQHAAEHAAGGGRRSVPESMRNGFVKFISSWEFTRFVAEMPMGAKRKMAILFPSLSSMATQLLLAVVPTRMKMGIDRKQADEVTSEVGDTTIRDGWALSQLLVIVDICVLAVAKQIQKSTGLKLVHMDKRDNQFLGGEVFSFSKLKDMYTLDSAHVLQALWNKTENGALTYRHGIFKALDQLTDHRLLKLAEATENAHLIQDVKTRLQTPLNTLKLALKGQGASQSWLHKELTEHEATTLFNSIQEMDHAIETLYKGKYTSANPKALEAFTKTLRMVYDKQPYREAVVQYAKSLKVPTVMLAFLMACFSAGLAPLLFNNIRGKVALKHYLETHPQPSSSAVGSVQKLPGSNTMVPFTRKTVPSFATHASTPALVNSNPFSQYQNN
jgi:hypothetical protein